MSGSVGNIYKEDERKVLEDIKNNKKVVVCTEFYKIIKVNEVKCICLLCIKFFKNNNTNKNITKNIFL